MIEHVRMVADWLDDPGYGVNPRLNGTQLYLCEDANASAESQFQKLFTPNTGAFTLTFRVVAGTTDESRITFARNSDGSVIIAVAITWSSGVPSVVASTGIVVSTTQVAGDLYEVILSGTVAVADTHILTVKIAQDAASTGTVYLGGWAVSSGTLSTDMTTWSAVFGATATACAAPVTTDSGDTAPAGVIIYDDSENAIVARKRWPQALGIATRALLVHDLGTDWQIGIQSGYQLGVCQVGVLLILPEAATDEAVEDTGYVMRAVRQAINALSAPAQESNRTRNGIVLENLRSLTEPPPEAEIADVMVMAALQSTWDVRDTTP